MFRQVRKFSVKLLLIAKECSPVRAFPEVALCLSPGRNLLLSL